MANRCSAGKAADICDYMFKLNTSAKEFFHTFVQDDDPALIKRRARWKTNIGIDGTSSLLAVFRDFLAGDEAGRRALRKFVLEEVHHFPPSYQYQVHPF